MSAFFGSTAIFSKYQPRPQSALSPDIFVHVAPASSDRKTPPWSGSASITAYTRRGLAGEIARPVRPIGVVGRPLVSCAHVSPPSVDFQIPPPGPFVGAYVYQGGRRAFHMPA